MVKRMVKKRHRGRVGFIDEAELPKRAGFKAQVQFNNNTKRSKYTMRRYRTHYRLMWTLERRYMLRSVKGLKEPGSYNRKNQHGGVMPALPGEFNLTNKQAGRLFQKIAKHKKEISYDQLRGVSGCMSYLYSLKYGKSGDNFPLVKEVLEGYWPTDYGQSKVLKPESIPTPTALKKAFTTGYHPATGWTYAKWVTGLIAAYCWAVFGCRSGVDLDSLKKSTTTTISNREGYAATAYKAGRNKLSGKKRGTRPWTAYFLCNCPNGKHKPVNEDTAKYHFDAVGNCTEPISWCTECPVNAVQFKIYRAQKTGKPMRLFSQWFKTPRNYASNHGSVVQLAIDWLLVQGGGGDRPYDTNAGRSSLAAWCGELKVPYHQSFEIHGDLFDVWSENYQPSVCYSDFARRKQSTSPRTCTAALRRLQHFFGRSPIPNVPEMTLAERLHVATLRSQGEHLLVEQVMAEWKRKQRPQRPSQDDEKTEDN